MSPTCLIKHAAIGPPQLNSQSHSLLRVHNCHNRTFFFFRGQLEAAHFFSANTLFRQLQFICHKDWMICFVFLIFLLSSAIYYTMAIVCMHECRTACKKCLCHCPSQSFGRAPHCCLVLLLEGKCWHCFF